MSYDFAGTNPRFEMQERHAKEDALTDKEFELMYEAAQRLDDEYYRLQCMFTVLVTGRLGLRRAEVAHLDESWIDWDEKLIRIPRYEECDCGDCWQKSVQISECNEGISVEEAYSHRWHPKTRDAIREVPFGFSARIEVVFDRFFSKHDEFPLSVMGVTRRVKRAAENCDGVSADDVYPHALRATASSYHAGRGLSVTPLQSMFGWADLETANKYVTDSGKNTARELRGIHNR